MNETFEEKKHISELNPEISDENDKNEKNTPPTASLKPKSERIEEIKGNFTWCEEMHKWVLTTFHDYQWDLNYANPAVFVDMTKSILHLANLGVEVFRIDAVPYIWKQLGTTCRNLPQVHIQGDRPVRLEAYASPGRGLQHRCVRRGREPGLHVHQSPSSRVNCPWAIMAIWENWL